MLHIDEVKKEEENLAKRIANLPDYKRKAFYEKLEKGLKDQDTYAVLNYIYIAGLHHFYLGKWARGSVNLVLFVVGIIFFFNHLEILGLALAGGITLIEVYAMIRSEVIVRDYNNQVRKSILETLR